MDINEIQEYLNKQYPDLNLNTDRRSPGANPEVIGRIQYGFIVEERGASTGEIDAGLKTSLLELIDLAQTDLDKMKIRDGVKQEILGVQAVLVVVDDVGEYWVSPEAYTKLLNEGGEGPQSQAAMAFDGRPIKYHEAIV